VPPNLFGIPFGIAGLAATWDASAELLGDGLHVVALVLFALAAPAWVAVLVAYLGQGPRQVLADLRDPVLAPFVPLAAVSMLLPAAALVGLSRTAAQVVVGVLLVVVLLVGGWLTGQWIVGDLDRAAVHPGYFLPTVAGGLVGAVAAVKVGFPGVAAVSFGIGVLCWVLLGSIVLNRLFVGGALPPPLRPTLAIELAPPAVGGIAYAALTGGRADLVAAGLGGYTVLMALVQLRFVPLFRALPFGPGFWAFTFSYAAAATDAVLWLGAGRPWGADVAAVVVLVLITGFIGAIGVRTAVLAVRGRLLPPRVAAAAA
jgi:tellurite resistance protein